MTSRNSIVYVDLEIHPFTNFTWPDGSAGLRHLAIPYGRPMRIWTRDDVFTVLRRAAALVPTTCAVSTGRMSWRAYRPGGRLFDGRLRIHLRVADGNVLGAELTFPDRLTADDVHRLVPLGNQEIDADLPKVLLAEAGRRNPVSRFSPATEHADFPACMSLPAHLRPATTAERNAQYDQEDRALTRIKRHRRGVAVHLARAAGDGKAVTR